MRYTVGYGPARRGIDAINLGSTLARTSDAALDVVVVVRDDAPTLHPYSPDRAYHRELEHQGHEWLTEGMTHVPEDVRAQGRVLSAESVTEGLLAAADDGAGSDMIIVGTAHTVRLGSVADALLHASSLPVALAPPDYTPQAAVTQITCAIGIRDGDEVLLNHAVRLAAAWRVPLRLMSLVAVGEGGSEQRRQDWIELARIHVESVGETAASRLPAECPLTTVVGHGSSLSDSVSRLAFFDGEIVMVGSSRLAQPKRIFLGRTANKIMRNLPVPMLLVPRDYE